MFEVEKELASEKLTFDFGKQSDWGFIRAIIHNYLASAWSFDQAIETIRPKVEWSGSLDQALVNYKKDSSVVLGLRHFNQHYSSIPVQIELSPEDPDRRVRLYTGLDDLKEYDYDEGWESHYSEISEDRIDLSQEITEHFQLCLELLLKIGEYGRHVQQEEVEEYEEIVEELPTYEDWDPPEDHFGETPYEPKDNLALELMKIGPAPTLIELPDTESIALFPELVTASNDAVKAISPISVNNQNTFARLIGSLDTGKLYFEILDFDERSDVLQEMIHSDEIFETLEVVEDINKLD